MMKSGSPQPPRLLGRPGWNPEEVAKEVTSCRGWRGPWSGPWVKVGLGGLLHLISVMPDWIGFKQTQLLIVHGSDHHHNFLPHAHCMLM